MKNISIWNKIYKNELFRPQYPNQNAEYFYLYHISKKKKSKLLDLGCGNFVNSKYFLEKKISVYSADFSYEALKSINYNKKIICRSENLPFKNNFFDYIFCDSVLYYNTFKQINKSIEEIHRVLKKHGIARITLLSDKSIDLVKTKAAINKFNKLEYNMNKTGINPKQIKKCFKNFKNLKIGMSSYNYVSINKQKIFYIITCSK